MNTPKNILAGRQKVARKTPIMSMTMIIALILIGIFSLAAYVTLSGFAGDLRRNDKNGKSHAMSRSAIGFAGLYQLLQEQDVAVSLHRTQDISEQYFEALRVFTLTTPHQLQQLEDYDLTIPTLVVLPKWRYTKNPKKKGWVVRYSNNALFSPQNIENRVKTLFDDIEIERIDYKDIAPDYQLDIKTDRYQTLKPAQIDQLQFMHNDTMVPLLVAERHIVLGQIADTEIYILSDPDFLNTMGLSTKSRAYTASVIMDFLMHRTETGESRLSPYPILFDLTVHGYENHQNLIKTLLTPPFLAATLCLLAAGMLVGWQAFARFGDPELQDRSLALGKFSLIDNGARLVALSEREASLRQDYVEIYRRDVAKSMSLERLSPEAIDRYFAKRETLLGMQLRWADLKTGMSRAEEPYAVLTFAQHLFQWKQEILNAYR